MKETVCQSCQTPAGQLHLCKECLSDLRAHLDHIPALIPSLNEAITKEARFSSGGGKSKNDAQPLPLNLNASARKHELSTIMVNLALRVQDLTKEPLPRMKWGTLAPWIHSFTGTLATYPEAGHWRDEIATAYRNGIRAIDKPAERLSIGECGYQEDDGEECPKELLARKDQRTITCPTCGTQWDVKQRQRDAIDAAWSAIDYPPVIIRALKAWNMHISTKDFQNWVQIKRLVPAEVDDDGRKMYRVKDVQDIALKMAARRR